MSKKQYVYAVNNEFNEQMFPSIKAIEDDIRNTMDEGCLIDIYELTKVKSGEVVMEEKVVWNKG